MPRNGFGLYLRKRIWCFRYRDPHTMLWREKSTGTTNKTLAVREKQSFLQQLENGTLPTELSEWQLDAAFKHWLEWRAATKGEKTYSCEKRYVRQVLKVLPPSRPLRSLRPLDLERYQVARRKNVGPRTVNLELGCLKSLLTRAGLWLRFRDHYSPLTVPRDRIGKIVPADAMERLVMCAGSNSEWQAMIWLAVLAHNTGARGGELKKLHIGDVDLTANVLRVRREATKTDAGARDIPLNPEASIAVRKLVERAAALGAAYPDHYLLPLNRSKHTRPSGPNRGARGFDPTAHQRSWSSAWRSLRKAAGLVGYRFHDFRWSFVTTAAEQGISIEVLMPIVGHTSPAMTRHYTAVRSVFQRQAVEAIGRVNRGYGKLLEDTIPTSSS